MRVVIQRVSTASVTVDGDMKSAIGHGLLILVGIGKEDTKDDAAWLAGKITQLRIFSDENGLMNKDILDVNGEIMVVSQFTLHAAYKTGNRPSFIKAANAEKATPLYEHLVMLLFEQTGRPIATGIFGADMKVALVNDGPVTIVMDTKNKE